MWKKLIFFITFLVMLAAKDCMFSKKENYFAFTPNFIWTEVQLTKRTRDINDEDEEELEELEEEEELEEGEEELDPARWLLDIDTVYALTDNSACGKQGERWWYFTHEGLNELEYSSQSTEPQELSEEIQKEEVYKKEVKGMTGDFFILEEKAANKEEEKQTKGINLQKRLFILNQKGKEKGILLVKDYEVFEAIVGEVHLKDTNKEIVQIYDPENGLELLSPIEFVANDFLEDSKLIRFQNCIFILYRDSDNQVKAYKGVLSLEKDYKIKATDKKNRPDQEL